MTGPALVLSDVIVGAAAAPAVGPVSLSLGPGEALALLGPNGAGKSTLLRVLVGLAPAHGRVEIDGGEAPLGDPLALSKMHIGYAPEGRRPFPGLTVDENLLAASDEGRRDRNVRLAEMYARFPALAARRRSEAWRLSGGEQQMLAIARALMRRPRLLLLDEPSLGLAPKAVEGLFQTIADIKADGVAIVLAEQNIGPALAIADQAVILANGVVRAAGPPQSLGGPAKIAAAYLT